MEFYNVCLFLASHSVIVLNFLFFLCNLQNYCSQIEVFLGLVSDRFALEIIARLRQTSIVRDKGSFKLKISECGIFYLFNNCTIHGVLAFLALFLSENSTTF